MLSLTKLKMIDGCVESSVFDQFIINYFDNLCGRPSCLIFYV